MERRLQIWKKKIPISEDTEKYICLKSDFSIYRFHIHEWIDGSIQIYMLTFSILRIVSFRSTEFVDVYLLFIMNPDDIVTNLRTYNIMPSAYYD